VPEPTELLGMEAEHANCEEVTLPYLQKDKGSGFVRNIPLSAGNIQFGNAVWLCTGRFLNKT
jgi:hypothetical protein